MFYIIVIKRPGLPDKYGHKSGPDLNLVEDINQATPYKEITDAASEADWLNKHRWEDGRKYMVAPAETRLI
jgi:hypothetical protein